MTATSVSGSSPTAWARRTKRRVNIGLVAGGLAIAVMIVWWGPLGPFRPRAADHQEHRGRIAAHGDQPGHHGAAGPCRRDPVPDPARDETCASGRTTSVSIRCASNSPTIGPQGHRRKSGLAQADELLEVAAGRRADQRIAVGTTRPPRAALGPAKDFTVAFDKPNAALPRVSRRAESSCDRTSWSARRVLSAPPWVGRCVRERGGVALGLWAEDESEYRG